MFSAIFVAVLATPFASGAQSCDPTNTLVCNPSTKVFSISFGTDFRSILTNIIILLLGFAGLVAMAYIIYGGFQIATARGNEKASEHGRKTLTNAIIGLVIIILSYIIVSVVVNAAFGKVNGRLPSTTTVPTSSPAPVPGLTPPTQ